MVHKVILTDLDRGLDELKPKNPYLYGKWEKHLKEDRNGINHDSQNAPITTKPYFPPHVRRGEKTK